MAAGLNRQVRLKARPTGIAQAEHFEIVETSVPELAERQFLVRNEYLSVEPAMRGWVSAVSNYATPVGIGEVMRSFAAGTVIASLHLIPFPHQSDLTLYGKDLTDLTVFGLRSI